MSPSASAPMRNNPISSRVGSPAMSASSAPARLISPRTVRRKRRRSGSDQHGHGAGDGHIEEINVSGMLNINNSEMLRRALLDGMGISMLAGWLVHGDLAEGSLVRVLADYQANPGSMDVGLYAMYPANRRGSVKVKAFVDLLAEQLQTTLQHIAPAGGAVPVA